jgi:hypothetical protein
MSTIAALFFLALPLLASDDANPPDAVLRAVLDLNDVQFAALHQMINSRETALADATREMSGLQQRLQQALNASAPDPVAVGNLVLSMRSVEKELAQNQEKLRGAFLSTLNDEQLQRVDLMHMVRAAILGGNALERLGL